MGKKPKLPTGPSDLANREANRLAREDPIHGADANNSKHTMRKRPHESKNFTADVGHAPSVK
jgi:hypothetical protein